MDVYRRRMLSVIQNQKSKRLLIICEDCSKSIVLYSPHVYQISPYPWSPSLLTILLLSFIICHTFYSYIPTSPLYASTAPLPFFYMSRKKKECYLEYANPNLNDIVLPFFTLIKAQQLSTGQLHNPTRNVSPPSLARETRSGPSILPPRRR